MKDKVCKKLINNETKFFKEICCEEFLELPCTHPDIENIVSVVVDYEIMSLKSIDTMEGESYEGQYLTGKKIAVEIKLRQKILYSANKETQSIHIFENEFYQSIYIVINKKINGTDPQVLINKNLLRCKIGIEDTRIRIINNRCIHKSLYIMATISVLPVCEICCVEHLKCPQNKVYLMQDNGSHVFEIPCLETEKMCQPVWSPTGREIVYVHNSGQGCSLYVYSLKLNCLEELVPSLSFSRICDVCWVADGTTLILSGSSGKSRNLYALGVNGNCLQQLTFGNGEYDSCKPKCSPCSNDIAFIRVNKGTSDIYTINTERQFLSKVTSCGCVKEFDWAPNGKTLIYLCNKNVCPDKFYLVDIESLRIEEISFHQHFENIRMIRFSSCTDYVAFIGCHTQEENIYIYNLHCDELIKVTDCCKGKILNYVWNADDNRIYCCIDEMFSRFVYSIDINTGTKNQIISSQAEKIEINYRPRIA